MRLDRLLVYLRFARTRSRAQKLIEDGHMRINGAHVRRPSADARIGDVLTFALGREIKIVELLALPERRGPPNLARSHYRELDRSGENAIATHNTRGS
jgi:ribosome-associated heat shock protein Hsp15